MGPNPSDNPQVGSTARARESDEALASSAAESLSAASRYPTPRAAEVAGRLRELMEAPKSEIEATIATLDLSNLNALTRTALKVMLEQTEKHLTYCDDLLREDFGLRKYLSNPRQLQEAAQVVLDGLIAEQKKIFANVTYLLGEDDAIVPLVSSLELASYETFQTIAIILNERCTLLMLEPSLEIPFDPTQELPDAETAISNLRAARSSLWRGADEITRFDGDVELAFGQGTQILRLIEYSCESAAYDGSVMAAHSDYGSRVLHAEKIYRRSVEAVIEKAPEGQSGEMKKLFEAVDSQIAVRKEKLKYDLREAWERVWAKERERSDPKIVEDD